MHKAKENFYRLSFAEQNTLTDEEKFVQACRADPIFAQEQLIGYNLNWYQKKTLRDVWTRTYSLLVWGRGASKTFMVAVISALWAMLYPGWRIGLISPVLRQTNYIFDELEEMYRMSAYLRRCCEKGPSRTPERSVLKFTHGSSIEGLPIGDGTKVRGRRYRFVIIDEAAQNSADIINKVVIPMMSVKKGGVDNKIMWTSSAYYKNNFFYPKYIRYRLKQLEEPELYCCSEYNYFDILADTKNIDYEVDMRSINEAKETMPADEFAMEYLAKFPDESMGFFPSALIASCIRREFPLEIELKGPSGKYIAFVDCGRKRDNFAISILKVVGHQKLLSRIIVYNNITFQEMNDIIRTVCVDYKVVRLGLDQGGGGLALKDYLAAKWTDERTGVEHPALLDMDDPEHKYTSGIHMVRIVHNTGPSKGNIFDRTKAEMEHGNLVFPIDVRNDPDPLMRDAGKQILLLKTEMGVLEVRPIANGGRKFSVPSKYSDDRMDSFVGAVDIACDFVAGEDRSLQRQMPIGFIV